MSPLARLLDAAIRGYQLGLSPMLPASCRFEPSCSSYTRTAIERYGALRGTWLGFKRILRCRPGGGSGYDPVPFPDDAPAGDG